MKEQDLETWGIISGVQAQTNERLMQLNLRKFYSDAGVDVE